MQTMMTIGCVALALASVTGSARAQEPSITLGRLTVSTGMAQAEVIRLAGVARQRLSVTPQVERTAIVWEKETTDDSNRILGSIAFENDRVKVVFKNWTPEQTEKDIDVGNALFSLAESFVQASNTRCTLSTSTRNEPGQQDQRVTLQCGRRSIEISTVRNDQYRILSTSVSESIK